jgi:carboxymethylenebutenolidase
VQETYRAIKGRRSDEIPTVVTTPEGKAQGVIVLAAEAYGINRFMRSVAHDLAEAGYIAITPDYYRGGGPTKPDDYSDTTEVREFVASLDFVRGTHDILAGIDEAVRETAILGKVPRFVWGYCTGGTLALLAAALDNRIDGAVLFFPSQPRFEHLTSKRPVHPIDMLWNVSCPMMLLYGDRDEPLRAIAQEFVARLEQWEIPNKICVYPGAGHAFSAPDPPFRNEAAATASWADAMEFIREIGPHSRSH